MSIKNVKSVLIWIKKMTTRRMSICKDRPFVQQSGHFCHLRIFRAIRKDGIRRCFP